MDIRETPWLTPESVSFLEELIKCNPDIKILEFGCGGSTIWFSRQLKSADAKVVSVEHDAEWHSAIKEKVGSNIDLRLLPRPYSSVCDEFPDNYFDLVLIDGRDRILCAAKSMRLVKHGGFVMLDNADRRIYAPIEEVLLKEWQFKRTAAYNCPEAAENNGWFTDIWRKPAEKNTANVPDDQLVGYGEDFARKGDLDNAETFARISLEANCRIADALNLLGVVSSTKNNQRNSMELFEAALTQDGNHINAGKNLATTYTKIGRQQDAIGIYKHLISLYPEDEYIKTSLRNLEAAQAPVINSAAPSGYSADFEAIRPSSFLIEVSSTCNLNCPECATGSGMKKHDKRFITLDEFKQIAEKIRPFSKNTLLTVWGEPMLNKDIIKMIQIASEFSTVGISTNGQKMTPKMAEKLIASGVHDIIVSIDGISQEVYAQYRVGGDVEKAKSALKMLQEANSKAGNPVNLIPQFIVFKHNQHEMADFQTFCNSLGLNSSFKAPYMREWTKLEKSDFEQYHRPEYPDQRSLAQAMMSCPSPKNDFTILVDGSVVLCCYDHDCDTVAGNIFEQNVMDIWNSEKYRSLRWSVISGNAPEFCKNNCLSYSVCKQSNCSAAQSASASAAKRTVQPVDMSNPQQAVETARSLFAQKQYVQAFDIYEQLLSIDPQNNIGILAEIYDCYKTIDQLDRYSLYQSRFFDFGIKLGDKVLDIGSGNAPFPFATHLADFSVSDNDLGRNGTPFKYVDGKPVYECDIENMPFADKEFDFIYCSHLLEHVNNPEAACRELMRVGKRGYIETPNRSKDLILNLARVSNHKWSVEEFNGSLIFTEYNPRQIEGLSSAVVGYMHLYPESAREKAITALIYLKADLFNTMLMWDGAFKYEVRRLDGSQTAVTQPQISLPSPAPAETTSGNPEPATAEWLQEITFKINQAQGDPAKLIEIGGELADRGEDTTAEQLARMIISQNPLYTDAYNLLGVIYFNRGEASTAQRYFETARRYEPNNTDIGKNLLGVYMQLEEYEKAIEICQSMLATDPNDPELPNIIGDLLETVSERALTGLCAGPTAEPAAQAECRPTAAHLVKFYSDMRYLPQDTRHITPLAPFWGISKDDAIEEGRFTRLYDTISEFISMVPLEDADAVLLPFDYTPGGHPYALEMAEMAATAGKPIVLFFGQDSTEEINVNNSIIFRTSFYKSTRKDNEFAMPAFCVDFIERYLDSRIPLKRKTDKPTVAFCGSIATDPSNTRGRSLEALAKSPLVDTSFVVRDGFWGSISEDSTREVTREEYVKNMVDADYVLCTRGTGNFSFRLYETLSCGRIPVFVDTDAVLPFEEFIDWKKYCVWVDQSEVDQIAQKVADFHASLTPDQFYDMQFNCRQLWEQWLSPHGFYSNLWRYLPVSEEKQSPVCENAAPAPCIETPYEAEKEVCEAIRRVVKPGFTCVDIGANMGLLTQFLAQLSGPNGRVVAFEPHPDNVSAIKDRIGGQVNAAPVTVESVAVSDGSAKSMPLYAGRNQSCFEWNLMGHDVDGNPTSAVLDVPTTSLDKYFKASEKIDFIKIDVEGAFAMVANGMKRVLETSHPVLMIEFHDDNEWAARTELINAGYELQDMNGVPVQYGDGAKRVYHCTAVPALERQEPIKSIKVKIKASEGSEYTSHKLNITPKTRIDPWDWASVINSSPVCLYAGDICDNQHQGWVGLSLNQNNSNHLPHDMRCPLPIPDASVDAFQSEDVFEHISKDQMVGIFNEIYRVLKPGARFRLSVPDYRCDVLFNRCEKDKNGNIIFDPVGGGTRENPDHLWFPTYEQVQQIIDSSRFGEQGYTQWLHVTKPDGEYILNDIDYSQGYIDRTPDNDDRVKSPRRPMSLVVDLYKSKVQQPAGQVKPQSLETSENLCLFINTCYPEFLNDHYAKNPNLKQASYADQKAMLEETFFGDADFYSNGMQQAGWDAENLIVNCIPLQQAWASENGFQGNDFDVAVEQIRRKKPSVVYLQNLGLATPEFLAAIRPYTRLIVGQIASPVPQQADVRGLDIIFSSFPHFVEQFRKMGITSYYQPLAFDPRVLDKIAGDDKRFGATFVGGVSKSHGKGTEFLEKVSSMMPVDVWGYGAETLDPGSPLRKAHHGEAWGLDMFSLLGLSKVTINRHIDVAENNANNMRLFEATGCGAMLITDYKDNLQDLFEIGREVVAYRTPEECAVLTKYYLDHPDEAEQIARAGQERTLKDHTYAKRMQQTAEILTRHLRYQHESEKLGSIDISNISSGYAMIGKSQISEAMTKGWQDENIPAKQRALVQPQLEAMYKGSPDQNFQVLTEILQPYVYPECSILEVGCASGYYYEILEYMLNKQINYTGVDYSEPLIKMAKDYYPNVDFRAADGANMPFEDKKFEIAISSGVLLHVPNYADHIKETARVASHYVVAHRTPVCRQRPTQYYAKRAYGAETIEMRFNEDEFISLFAQNGLELINAFEYFWQPQNDAYDVTYLFRKKEK